MTHEIGAAVWVERVKWPDHPHDGARGIVLGATVDLDFDVVVIGGEATLVDEDEFEEHRQRYAYPAAVVAGARAAAADVYERVSRRSPPSTEEDGARWQAVLAELTGALAPGTARSPRDR